MSSNGAPVSQPCCSFVGLAGAFNQIGVAAQPMQVFMVAPMSMQQGLMPPLQDFSAMMMASAQVPPSVAGMHYPWPEGWSKLPVGAWPNFGGSSFWEDPPQQLPMNGTVMEEGPPFWDGNWMQGWPTETQFESEVHSKAEHVKQEVPTQVQMDSATLMPQIAEQEQTSRTLRPRRGQELSVQESHRVSTQDSVDLKADEDRNEDAGAAEIASAMIGEFKAEGNSQQLVLAKFARLSFDSKTSSLAAQRILETAAATEVTVAAAFANGLRGHIRSAVQSKHANHVVQKITEVMPVGHASFVVDELKGFGQETARHVFGCRVLCRILEHLSPNDSSALQLLEELLSILSELCKHPYGSFVVRHLLEFGVANHKHRVVEALRSDLPSYSKHKFGSHVVEAALQHASLDDQQVMSSELLRDKQQLVTLAGNQFGRHVVRALLTMPGNLRTEAIATLRPMESQLKASRYGKSVIQVLRGL